MTELSTLRHQLHSQQHRQLVVLSGEPHWQKQQLHGLFKVDETVFYINGNQPGLEFSKAVNNETLSGFENIESKRLKYHLGQEVDGAIFNAEVGIGADALGIVAGMIKAGGLLIVLTPAITSWKKLNNPEDVRFLSTPLTLHQALKGFTLHLLQTWQQESVIWLHQDADEKSNLSQPENSTSTNTADRFQDQQLAIQKIQSVAFGHRKRPLVINADRGRGKTAALGIGAVQALLQGKKQIAITSSRPDQVKTAFEFALQTLQDKQAEVEAITHKSSLLEFNYQGEFKSFVYIAPDQLVLTPTLADMLMVDEAAHLPTPLLIELLKRHHRMVFATTLHGYEGSGRGFELRFKKHLNEFTPDWRLLEMQMPLRWAPNDPLEKSINKSLMLDIPLNNFNEQEETRFDAQQVRYELLDSQDLLQDKKRFQSLFALLVQAHYQTSPNDLQQLLNAPNIKIITAEYERPTTQSEVVGEVVGAVLCVEEGKINPSQSRAHGHLVPQLLTRHYAQSDFQMLSTLRIMRVAVHPSLQRQGIGKGLIKRVEQLGLETRHDYISSSFGSSDELLPFWFEQHFWPLHVGVKRDKASGTHNIVVAKPVSAMSRQALSLIQTRFQEQFPHLLLESLPHLPARQILQIIQTFRFKTNNYGLDKALTNYVNGERPYESISSKLWEWSLQSANTISQTSQKNQSIWCDKVLKKNDWQTVAHEHHLAGRKGVEQAMKEMANGWLVKRPRTARLGLTKPYV